MVRRDVVRRDVPPPLSSSVQQTVYPEIWNTTLATTTKITALKFNSTTSQQVVTFNKWGEEGMCIKINLSPFSTPMFSGNAD